MTLSSNLSFNLIKKQPFYPISIKHGLWTTDCGLGIKYGLGMKRGLENTDWV